MLLANPQWLHWRVCLMRSLLFMKGFKKRGHKQLQMLKSFQFWTMVMQDIWASIEQMETMEPMEQMDQFKTKG